MEYNKSFKDIGLSPIVEISEKAKEIAPEFEKRTKKPFIYFQRGEVGFDTPLFISENINKAISNGMTKYPKSGGEYYLKDAIINMLHEDGIEEITRENIVITHGGQEGLQLVFNLFEGATVASFFPIWSCMLENILPYSKNSKLISIPFKEEGGKFKIDFRGLDEILENCDILYLNNPNNPTGKVFNLYELKTINDLCLKHNVKIVSDEAYKDIVFDGENLISSLSLYGDHIISVFTFSKTFAATGFRIGYVVSRDKNLIEKLIRGDYTQTAGVPSFIQYAFSEGIKDINKRTSWIKNMSSVLQERRDIIFKELHPIFKDDLIKPEGGFCFFLNLNKFSDKVGDTEEKIMNTFMKNGIAVVPGSSFGNPKSDKYIRVSYSALNTELVTEGVKRIKEILS